MPTPTINPDFAPLLGTLGQGVSDFFLAAGLYDANKVSFAAAAALASLGYEELHYRLKEHFGHGFVVADESVQEDLRLVEELARSACETGHQLSPQVR